MKETHRISSTWFYLPLYKNKGLYIFLVFIGVMACGGLYAINNLLYYAPCDLIQEWEIKLDCLIRKTPRPVELSIPNRNVNQLTFDVAFYNELHWSPDGRYLVAQRCIENSLYSATCFNVSRRTILIDIKTREIQSGKYFSSGTQFFLWSPNGAQMFLYIPQSKKSLEGIYTLASGEFEKVELPMLVLGWDDSNNELLGIHSESIDLNSKEDRITGRRYSLRTGKIQDEYTFTILGWFYYILSPSKKMLLLTHYNFDATCSDGEVLSYEIGVDHAPKIFSSNMCNPSWSFDGRKIVHTLSTDGESRIVTISDADGRNPQPLFTMLNPLRTSSVAWSPDGTQIAFTYGNSYNAIYIIDVPPHLRPSNP